MAWLDQLYQWTTHHMFCIFHAVTGFYCPGCGGTRSVYHLLSGHPLLSLQYHPITLYTIVGVTYVGLRLFANRFVTAEDKKYHPSPAWLWVALAIILINWFIKNLFLRAWGIDLLP